MIHHYKGITIERSQNTTPGGGIDKITLAELLAEAGYCPEEIASLREAGVVA